MSDFGTDWYPIDVAPLCLSIKLVVEGQGKLRIGLTFFVRRVENYVTGWQLPYLLRTPPGLVHRRRQSGIWSAILGDLVDSDHQIDLNQAFKRIYATSRNQPEGNRFRMIAAAEAIAIRLHNSQLCSLKKLVQTPSLPWPSTTNLIDTKRGVTLNEY